MHDSEAQVEKEILIESKFYIIKNRIVREITAKEAGGKEYYDDLKIVSPDGKTTIINLDEKKIKFYVMELLNSMSELSFVSRQKMMLFVSIFILILSVYMAFTGKVSDSTVEKLQVNFKTLEAKIDNLDKTATETRHRNITQ